MSNNIRRQGAGLNTLFALRHSGWPQNSNTNIRGAGTDISATYAPASTGTAYGTTGILSAGVDIGTLFAGLGTTGVQVAQQPNNVSGSLAAGNPSGTVTSNTTTVAGTKGGGTYTYTWVIASGSASFTAPNSATTGVTATVNASSTINGTMYCTISDGITSVNTNTVTWSLQNTSTSSFLSGSQFTAGVFGTVSPTDTYWVGYFPPFAGTMLTTPSRITQCMDYYNRTGNGLTPEYNTNIEITGFTSDPGIGWGGRTLITGTGINHVFANAIFYSYNSSSGTAFWRFNGVSNFVSGTTYTIQIV